MGTSLLTLASECLTTKSYHPDRHQTNSLGIVAMIHIPRIPPRIPHLRNVNIPHDFDAQGQTGVENRTQVHPIRLVLVNVSRIPQPLDKISLVQNPVGNEGEGVAVRVRFVEGDGLAVFGYEG